MKAHAQSDAFEHEQELLCRYGLEHDPRAEHEQELELADRLADQASLSPGAARKLARQRLGRGPSPYEQPHEPEPQRLATGERVNHHRPDGPRPGRVVRVLEREGVVEVEFDRHGTTFVAADELEREAA
jgi:hypothetical protein